MSRLIIFGTGKIAQVVYSFLKDEFDVAAFTIDRELMQASTLFDIPVIAFDEIESRYPPEANRMLIAIGYHEMNKVRAVRYEEAKAKGYTFINYIHHSVHWHDSSEIGENNVIMDHVSIQPSVKIGNSNLIWSNAVVAHGSEIRDNCWITSGVTIAGDTVIGSNAFLGINATVGHNITLAKENFIGANTLISKSTKDREVYVSRDGERFKLDSERFLQFTGV